VNDFKPDNKRIIDQILEISKEIEISEVYHRIVLSKEMFDFLIKNNVWFMNNFKEKNS